MKQSPLQLKHYTLTEVSIKPYEGYASDGDSEYPSFDDVDFSSSVEFGPAHRKGEESRGLWGIRLHLVCKATEENSFPYQFNVGAAGVFDGENLPEGDKSNLVLVNGTSLLYGVLRDEVLRLTSRMFNGPVMLPTVQFSQLAEQSDMQSNGNEKAHVESVKKARSKTLKKL